MRVYFLAENYIVVPAFAYDIEKQTLVGQFRFYRGITPFILRIGVSFFANVNIQNHKSHAFSIQNRILSKCWLKRGWNVYYWILLTCSGIKFFF